MVLHCTDDFAVIWEDPEDGNLRWGRDRLHLPRPMPPLVQAFGVRLAVPFTPASRVVFLNGYPFITRSRQGLPPTQGRPPGDWEGDLLPRIKEICSRLREGPYSELSAEHLAGILESLFEDAVSVFQYTLEAGRSLMDQVTDFYAFCETELPPDGQALACTLLQGFENESARAGRALANLAALAANSPHVAGALLAKRYQRLELLEGGEGFLQALRAFLDEYGWRAESWGLTHIPVWAEAPHVALGFVARYLKEDTVSSFEYMQRSAVEREQARAEAEARLASEKRERFRNLLASIERITQLSEGRAFWQLTAAGVLRVPILALGQKLVDAGVIDEPNDVFFLYLDEVKEVALKPRDMKEPVAVRKSDFERWESLVAPASVGAPGPPPAPPDPAMQAVFRIFLGVGAPSSVEGNVIKGSGASKGIVRGRARVIRSLAEADRLEPGDILVCQTTSPSWTPLFAIAAAVVTDAGGILSHSAICAREYGIPCVVATQVATSRIADWAYISVDGVKGTVTIEAAEEGLAAETVKQSASDRGEK